MASHKRVLPDGQRKSLRMLTPMVVASYLSLKHFVSGVAKVSIQIFLSRATSILRIRTFKFSNRISKSVSA